MSRFELSFSDTEITALEKWTDEDRLNLCLTMWVDSIGFGFALCPVTDLKKAIYLIQPDALSANDVYNAIESLRTAIMKYNCSISYASMSFAGPPSPDNVIITNWNCSASSRIIIFSEIPFDVFPLDRRLYLNDIEACSYGIIHKSLENSLPKLFTSYWNKIKNDQIPINGSSCIFSISDGTGISFICKDGAGFHNCVVSTEAGHTIFSVNPIDEKHKMETDFLYYLSRKLYAGRIMPEWEDVCAYKGLTRLYSYLKKKQKIKMKEWPSYDEIWKMAVNDEDDDAKLAFKIHYGFIMVAAQSLSLISSCKRVFVISKKLPNELSIIEKNKDFLKEVFEDHPRNYWLKDVRVYFQKAESHFVLSGGLYLSKIYSNFEQLEDLKFG